MDDTATYILSFEPTAIIVAMVALFVVTLVNTAMVFSTFRRVQPGTALVRSGMRGNHVTFTGAFVFPVIDSSEVIDIRAKALQIELKGDNAVTCQDGIEAEAILAYLVRVNDTAPDVLRVATTVGCKRASSEEGLKELFQARFTETTRAVIRRYPFEAVWQNREDVKQKMREACGDLVGFVIDDVSFENFRRLSVERQSTLLS